MNGFCYFTGGKDTQIPDPNRIAPIAEGSTFDLKSFGGGDYLLTWGHAGGDVCCAKQSDKVILILSGYIVEFESGPEFKTQKEAAGYLLEQFLNTDSDKALQNILNRIYGSFSFVIRDIIRNITICGTDRVSSRPLWRSWQTSGWILSTHSAAIALSIKSPRIDLAGLGAFMLYGGPLTPSRSLFREVEAIPPGSIVRLGTKGEANTFKWYHFRHKEDKGLSPNEWAELVGDRLVRSATRIVKHCQAPAIFFSGGTDSRLAAAAMKAAGSNPLVVTLADSSNLEIRVAKMAAKVLGLDHKIIIRERHWYLRTLPRVIYETGGNYLWTHGHFSTAAGMVIKNYGSDVFLLGDLCEAFSKLLCSIERSGDGEWTWKKLTNDFDSIRLPLYRPYNRNATLSLFKAGARKQIEDWIRFDIEQRFKEVYSLSSDPLIVADLCFRWEAITICPTFFMFLDLRSVCPERNLMFDRDAHQLLEMMPSEMRNGRNLGAHVIRGLSPMAGLVMNSNSLVPMVWPPSVHKLSKRVKPALGILRRLLMGKSHITTGSWPEHSALYVSDGQWRRCFENILRNYDLFDSEIFDIEAIRQCWEDLVNGQGNRYSDAEKLLQIGLLGKMFANGAKDFVQEEMVSKI